MIVLLALIGLTAGAVALLYNARVQQALARTAVQHLSAKMQTKITYSSIRITLFNSIIINDLFIEGLEHDTLLYSKRVAVNLKSFNPAAKRLKIRHVVLDEAYLNLKGDSTNTFNLQVLLNRMSSTDTTGQGLKIFIGKIELNNSTVSIKQYNSQVKDFGINLGDARFSHIDARIDDVEKLQKGMFFNVKRFAFVEKSGFKLNNLSTRMLIGKSNLELQKLKIEAPATQVESNYIFLAFESFKDFRPDSLPSKLKFEINLEKVDLSSSDLAYWVPVLKGVNQKVKFKGTFKGKLSDFKGDKVEIKYGSVTHLACDFTVTGLPSLNDMFLYVKVDDLTSAASDIEKISIPGKTQRIVLPKELTALGKISYKGKFTGFINDFVAFGKFRTALGVVSTDLSIKPDASDFINLQGKLRTDNFKLGDLLDKKPLLGALSLDVEVKGKAELRKSIDASMDGQIKLIEVNGYAYQNLTLSGKITNQTFDGFFSIDDPNVKLNFDGKWDVSTQVPKFDFNLNVAKADLSRLNFSKRDTTLKVAFNMSASLSGNSLQQLNGNIFLGKLNIDRNGHKAQVDTFTLNAVNSSDGGHVEILSDVIDGEINGRFNPALIFKSLNSFVAQYLPALQSKEQVFDSVNNFNFQFKLKRTDELLAIFLPAFEIPNNSNISGTYRPLDHKLNLFASLPQFKIRKIIWSNLNVNIASSDSLLTVMTSSDDLMLNDKMHLQNFNLQAAAQHNRVDARLRWNVPDTVDDHGNIAAFAVFSKPDAFSKIITQIVAEPSEIVLRDSVWAIQKALVTIDSSGVGIERFKMSCGKQVVQCFGRISPNEADTLYATLDKINMLNLGLLFKGKGIRAEGELSGTAALTNLKQAPVFYTKLMVDSLLLNGEKIGATYVNANWNGKYKRLDIQGHSMRGLLTTLTLDGTYLPEDKTLDVKADLYKTRLNILRPYLDKIVSDISGIATGRLRFYGLLSAPDLDASLKVQKASFLINYLQTRYSFSSKNFQIDHNKFIFDDIVLNDDYGNTAIVKGDLTETDFFKDIALNINISTSNFQVLNTTIKNNTLYYGDVFAGGSFYIGGTAKNIIMNINAKTGPNSEFNIPLSTKSELTSNTFVTFVTPNQRVQTLEAKPAYEVDLSGLQLNFNLEATPDAICHLIFDSKIGDVITGKGHGNIKLDINSRGKFSIYGDYNIEQGDYLFTLQNVVNKKFDVVPGGTIVWNGTATDAIVNLQAKYVVRTSLSGLLASTQEEYKKRIPVECQIYLTDKLMSPSIRYDISLPSVDQETSTLFRNAVNTEEEKSKQFLSLLWLNSFFFDQNSVQGTTATSTTTSTTNIGAVTASELLSNQLSNWISQISNDFDLGFKYSPGDSKITSDEVELALSTQLLNDRIIFNGNVDVGGQQVTSKRTNIAGDFDLEYKVGKSDKVRFKIFNRSNDMFMAEISPYTQGVGIFYREEFNTFSELFERYKEKFKKKGMQPKQ